MRPGTYQRWFTRLLVLVAVAVPCPLPSWAGEAELTDGGGVAESALLSLLPPRREGDQPTRLKRWAVVEGAPVVQARQETPPELAATVSVLSHLNGGLGAVGPLFRPDPDVVAELAGALASMPGGKDRQSAVMAAYERMVAELQAEFREIIGAGGPGQTPSGVGLCRVLERAMPGGNSADKANADRLVLGVSHLLQRRLYEPDVRLVAADDEVCRELLNNRIPFVVLDSPVGGAAVCLGYAETDRGTCWVLGAPCQVPTQELSRADLVIGQGDMATRLREVNRRLDGQFGPLAIDYRFSLQTALKTPGIRMMPWKGGTKALIICRPRPSRTLINRFCVSRLASTRKE